MDILVRMLWMFTTVNNSQRLGMIKFRKTSKSHSFSIAQGQKYASLEGTIG